MPTAGDPGPGHAGQSKAHEGASQGPHQVGATSSQDNQRRRAALQLPWRSCHVLFPVASSLLLRVLLHLCLSAFSINGASWHCLKPVPTCSLPMPLASHACCMKESLQTLFPSVPVLRGADVGSGFPGSRVMKNLPVNAGDLGSIPGSGRSPGAGNSNPLQYSCLENPMDRGAWRATVHGGVKELDTTEGTQHARMTRGQLFPDGCFKAASP